MNCDICGRKINYNFYIDDKHWKKVVGNKKFKKNQGRLCVHCVLEKLGGLEWYINWNEQAEKMHKSMDEK